MKYLCDTNIFIEILMERKHHKDCFSFINRHIAECAISDFSLFSLGIHAERHHQEELIYDFLLMLFEKGLRIIHTDHIKTLSILLQKTASSLDFDDYLQYRTAKDNGLTLITLDKDFFKTKLDIRIERPF